MVRINAASFCLLIGVFFILLALTYHGAIIQALGIHIGLSALDIGIVSSAQMLGFLMSCYITVNVVNNVGHVRVYAAMTAIFSGFSLLFPIWHEFYFWIAIQFLCGFSLAGIFIVVESWINESSDNANRGTVMGIYVVVVTIGKVVGYYFINVADETIFYHFSLISLLMGMSVVPVLLIRIQQPELQTPEPIAFKSLFKISPAGVLIILFSQMSCNVINTLGVTYAIREGINSFHVSNFMAVIMVGTIVLQYPVGKISDLFDRRLVMSGVSLAVVIFSAIGWLSNLNDWYFWLSLFIGLALVFTIYSIAVAHVNDFLKPSQRVSVTGQLMLFAGIGMTIGPVFGGFLMNHVGNNGFFLSIVIINSCIIAIGLYRMSQRKAPEEGVAYALVPARSTHIVAEAAELVDVDTQE